MLRRKYSDTVTITGRTIAQEVFAEGLREMARNMHAEDAMSYYTKHSEEIRHHLMPEGTIPLMELCFYAWNAGRIIKLAGQAGIKMVNAGLIGYKSYDELTDRYISYKKGVQKRVQAGLDHIIHPVFEYEPFIDGETMEEEVYAWALRETAIKRYYKELKPIYDDNIYGVWKGKGGLVYPESELVDMCLAEINAARIIELSYNVSGREVDCSAIGFESYEDLFNSYVSFRSRKNLYYDEKDEVFNSHGYGCALII